MMTDFSGEYSIDELFDVGGVVCSATGNQDYLTSDNCIIVNKTLAEDCVLLLLKRDSDGLEGRSEVKIKSQFNSIPGLLQKFFANQETMFKSLDDIRSIKITI